MMRSDPTGSNCLVLQEDPMEGAGVSSGVWGCPRRAAIGAASVAAALILCRGGTERGNGAQAAPGPHSIDCIPLSHSCSWKDIFSLPLSPFPLTFRAL